MEIKSIKEIKNIGTFSSFTDGASLRLEKLNFIYGLNAYGKTTLADIFQSWKDNDNPKIINRQTIPNQDSNQKIVLSIKEGKDEKDLKFDNNQWKQNIFTKNLEVFGTDFIHKNVFTGLAVKRENKVNFTQFVLGDEGVKLAEKIAEDKKELAYKKRNLPSKLPEYVKQKNEQEQKKFLDFSIEELDKTKIDEELTKKKTEKQNEENRLKEPEKILSLPEINDFSIPCFFSLTYLEKTNELLQKDYQDIKNDTLSKINNHVQNNFKNTDGVENWIKQGLDNCKDKESGNCNFCGQNLQNAQDLIKAYDSYFDEAYNKFIRNIENDLSANLSSLQNEKFNFTTSIQNILTNSLKYKEFINDDNFQKLLTNLESELKKLNQDTLINLQENLITTIQSKIKEKHKKPYQAVETINFDGFKDAIDFCKEQLKFVKGIIIQIEEITKEFKEKYKDTSQIQESINAISKEIQNLEFQKTRIAQDKNCKSYLKEKKEIDQLLNQTKNQEEALNDNQSQYLDRYFKKINELFQKFGSQNFTLEQTNDKKGHGPVYFLNVKFNNKLINQSELQNVFSESDRRALALAIFWAKIDLKPEEDKKSTVIILDDPITSFDENRITNTIDLIKSTLENTSQIIVLTHYPNFIRRFCEITKENQITTKFFEIKKNDKTSLLTEIDRIGFTETQYEKIFSKIMGYINREHDNCIKSDLRPFLENMYIPTIFAKELREAKNSKKDLSTLEKTIDAIFTDESVKSKMHEFRKNLNPEAHISTSNNEEDVRTFAQGMMDFLYSFELKANAK